MNNFVKLYYIDFDWERIEDANEHLCELLSLLDVAFREGIMTDSIIDSLETINSFVNSVLEEVPKQKDV